MLSKPHIRLNNLLTSLRFPYLGLNPIIDSINLEFYQNSSNYWDRYVHANSANLIRLLVIPSSSSECKYLVSYSTVKQDRLHFSTFRQGPVEVSQTGRSFVTFSKFQGEVLL